MPSSGIDGLIIENIFFFHRLDDLVSYLQYLHISYYISVLHSKTVFFAAAPGTTWGPMDPEPADSSPSCTLPELVDVDVSAISHERLKDLTGEVLNTVLDKDSVLGDLPNNVTLGEVDLQIAIEHGRAITVYLERFDGIVIPIVVSITYLNAPNFPGISFWIGIKNVIYCNLSLSFLGTEEWSKSGRLEKEHRKKNDVTFKKSWREINHQLETNMENLLVKL